ncbi:MAG: NAD-dependent protein deacylase, partial [Clostridiales bacterium]|nr:NAD-dependent protein deacylase [Clostridiales bacterium]
LYEEPLKDDVMRHAIAAIQSAGLLIVGGTSLNVYPAAGMIDYFRGEQLVLINQSPTRADKSASLVVREPIGDVFGEMFPELFS